jgi:hypothetical protein
MLMHKLCGVLQQIFRKTWTSIVVLLFGRIQNNMAAACNLYLALSLIVITNRLTKLGTLNLVRELIIINKSSTKLK